MTRRWRNQGLANYNWLKSYSLCYMLLLILKSRCCLKILHLLCWPFGVPVESQKQVVLCVVKPMKLSEH